MNNTQLLNHSKTWDRTGVLVAGLCLLHCLAVPLVVVAMPTTQFFFDSFYLELTILTLGVLVGSISFITSFRKHRKFYPMLVGALGVAFLFTNLVMVPLSRGRHDHLGQAGASLLGSFDPLMVLGGTFLIIGHLWNIHACHCFCDQTCGHVEHHH